MIEETNLTSYYISGHIATRCAYYKGLVNWIFFLQESLMLYVQKQQYEDKKIKAAIFKLLFKYSKMAIFFAFI